MIGVDMFFYWGQCDLGEEIEQDLAWTVIQPQKSMFYNRSYGIRSRENDPSSLVMQIGLKYDIINTLGRRNMVVTIGNNDYPDRRVAASQLAIEVSQDGKGETDVTVEYIPFFAYNKKRSVTMPLGGI